ncbi:hypothetical protein JGH11_11635 [Dysgonomonas sp. Marseille-P4677]|uniref:LPS assembly lipoprotein LptE n=1 Tax=Dysgonomonas sp. Marseille-P4677 TaxID=2364790 RepID=UPI001911A069|nr:LPS assembly lipoprotein LptE [Dysgonomonas sp. Marseille-P4677]MBK5721524.1 hypothetical protein [Dysgonomonas sp. Marseille-P4677]
MKKAILLILFATLMTTCTVSYKFNGASINYAETPDIEIRDFQNQALLVYPPLAQVFNERMKDVFTRNTKLKFTSVNPSLEIEGEIVRYDIAPLSVREDNLASQTRLTMGVKMRFRNNKNPAEDKEETITAYRDFDSNLMLTDVQESLVDELTKDIVDQIFNATMSNW